MATNNVRVSREIINSAAWHAIAGWAAEEIQILRARNDNVALTPEETAALRGEIKALKRLLDQAKPPAPVVMEATVAPY